MIPASNLPFWYLVNYATPSLSLACVKLGTSNLMHRLIEAATSLLMTNYILKQTASRGPSAVVRVKVTWKHG